MIVRFENDRQAGALLWVPTRFVSVREFPSRFGYGRTGQLSQARRAQERPVDN